MYKKNDREKKLLTPFARKSSKFKPKAAKVFLFGKIVLRRIYRSVTEASISATWRH